MKIKNAKIRFFLQMTSFFICVKEKLYLCNMKEVKITAIRKADYKDLQVRYENPIEHTCDVCVGQCWLSRNGKQPEGLCDEAWKTMHEFVEELARGGGNFYDGWMKNPHSAMISCNDGFRPVSFLIETD